MIKIEEFYEKYPLQSRTIKGKDFKFRYYVNGNSKETLVLLTGGIGFSDLFYRHFDDFAKDFSVITFDYHKEFPTAEDFSDAVCDLLNELGIKGWLVGQSLGGFVSQVIAKYHPDVVKGLVLSNTGTLSKDLSKESMEFLLKMTETQLKLKKLLKFIPWSLYKKITVSFIRKMGKDLQKEEKILLEDMCSLSSKLMNKPYEEHMIDFLCGLCNSKRTDKNDFAYLKNNVMLILSDDDKTFTDDIKNCLIDIMPSPKVVKNLEGGHLAMILKPEAYEETVKNFILSRT